MPALVSSKVYRQLEFLAVGSWFCYGDEGRAKGDGKQSAESDSHSIPHGLRRIPGGREDVFTDKSIDLRSARSVMKFLKQAGDPETLPTIISEWGSNPFPQYLSSNFKIPVKLQEPLLALTLSPFAPSDTTTSFALPRIHRHLTSIGMFGPGFGSVISKWGGLSEVAQVGCRAGAVGGGVYVLKRGIREVAEVNATSTNQEGFLEIELDDDSSIHTRFLSGTLHDVPALSSSAGTQQAEADRLVDRSITIVSSSLDSLFPAPVEGAPPPACAIIVFPVDSLGTASSTSGIEAPSLNPVYLSVHSSDTGECPAGQCTSTASPPYTSRLHRTNHMMTKD